MNKMMKNNMLIAILSIIVIEVIGQNPPKNILKGDYFGQIPPGNIPEVFLPEVFNQFIYLHGKLVFSPNGKSFLDPVLPGSAINSAYSDTEPSVAPDNSYIVFISNRPGGYSNSNYYCVSAEVINNMNPFKNE